MRFGCLVKASDLTAMAAGTRAQVDTRKYESLSQMFKCDEHRHSEADRIVEMLQWKKMLSNSSPSGHNRTHLMWSLLEKMDLLATKPQAMVATMHIGIVRSKTGQLDGLKSVTILTRDLTKRVVNGKGTKIVCSAILAAQPPDQNKRYDRPKECSH